MTFCHLFLVKSFFTQFYSFCPFQRISHVNIHKYWMLFETCNCVLFMNGECAMLLILPRHLCSKLSACDWLWSIYSAVHIWSHSECFGWLHYTKWNVWTQYSRLITITGCTFFTDHLNLIMHLGTKINQSEMSALRLQPNSNVSANSPAGDETIF